MAALVRIERDHPSDAHLGACKGENIVDAPNRRADNGIHGKKDLFVLLMIYAPSFIALSELIQEYLERTKSVPSGTTFRDQAEYDETVGTLRRIRDYAATMNLSVSTLSMEQFIADISATVPGVEEIRRRLSEWYSCFKIELQTIVCLVLLPHRVPFFNVDGPSNERWGGHEWRTLHDQLAPFPDAHFDSREAGLCMAVGRSTACVYHLMRLAEHGLVSVAAEVQVSSEKLSKGWDGCIQGIEAAIKIISSTKPTADWQDQIKKYSDLCSWFTTIKNGWRNPVSHVPRIYSEESARGMFAATKTLFEHLNAYGFKQTAMPSEPLKLPEV